MTVKLNSVLQETCENSILHAEPFCTDMHIYLVASEFCFIALK